MEHSGKSHLWSHQCHGVSHGWPFVAKFNNVYLYATIYIDSTSTQHIFIQRLYSFNFNRGYFCARQIFIQLQRPKLCFMKRIYIFNFNKNRFSFNKTYLFNSSSSRISINSYSTKLDLPTPLPPGRPFFKNLETTKGLFIWSRVAETTLPPSYPGGDIFSLICLKNYINRLHEMGETTREGETTRGGELSRLGRWGNPGRRDNFFACKRFGSPTRDETVGPVLSLLQCAFILPCRQIFIAFQCGLSCQEFLLGFQVQEQRYKNMNSHRQHCT